MSRLLTSGLAALAMLSCATVAQAIDYRSVTAPALLYDTPSEQGKPLYIIAAGTPVEVVVATDKWIKVRDASGAITWISSNALGKERMVIVTAQRTQIRQRPQTDAPVVFEAEKNLVLHMTSQPTDGWVQVRHTDGSSGYIRIMDIWGA